MSSVQLPRKERYPTDVAATVRVAGAAVRPCRMTDISHEGCRLETAETLPIGAVVEIREPRLGTLHAQVRWGFMGIAGCRFTTAD